MIGLLHELYGSLSISAIPCASFSSAFRISHRGMTNNCCGGRGGGQSYLVIFTTCISRLGGKGLARGQMPSPLNATLSLKGNHPCNHFQNWREIYYAIQCLIGHRSGAGVSMCTDMVAFRQEIQASLALMLKGTGQPWVVMWGKVE